MRVPVPSDALALRPKGGAILGALMVLGGVGVFMVAFFLAAARLAQPESAPPNIVNADGGAAHALIWLEIGALTFLVIGALWRAARLHRVEAAYREAQVGIAEARARADRELRARIEVEKRHLDVAQVLAALPAPAMIWSRTHGLQAASPNAPVHILDRLTGSEVRVEMDIGGAATRPTSVR